MPTDETTPRLRLAVVSDSVYPWNTGGKELRYHNLLSRLAGHGISVDVYTMNWWGTGGQVEHDAVTYHAIAPHVGLYSGGRRSIRQAVVFSLASLRMLTRRFDVLEADAIPFMQLFPLKLVALLRRRPLVVTWHEFWGRDYWVQYLGAPGRVAAAIESAATRFPDVIVAASEGTAQRVRSAGGERITVVPNGIDPQELERVSAPAGEVDLLVVGRLLDHKNVDLAIEATALLRDGGRAVTLSVIGEGPERDALRDLAARLGLEEAVTFRDFLPDRATLLGELAAARLLVFPSVREGFGMVALEALASGTPVVTCDHPDNFARELIDPGVNGELCAPTASSLAEAIARALDHREDLARAARAVLHTYTWGALAEDLAGAYHAAGATADRMSL